MVPSYLSAQGLIRVQHDTSSGARPSTSVCFSLVNQKHFHARAWKEPRMVRAGRIGEEVCVLTTYNSAAVWLENRYSEVEKALANGA